MLGSVVAAKRRGGFSPAAPQTVEKPFPGGLEGPQALQVKSYRPAFPGRSIFAEGADRAHRSFRSLANIGVLRAAARSPCICSRLRVALRYAQQPAGLTLPSGAPSGRFATFGGKCPGCSIIRASLTVALMVSLPRFGSLWAFGPSAHRAHASLRATGHTLPSGAPSGRFAAFGGNSPQG